MFGVSLQRLPGRRRDAPAHHRAGHAPRPSAETRTSPEEAQEATEKEDIAIVPLAIPLLAGPGAIATVMVLMSRAAGVMPVVAVVLSIVITMAASYFLLRGAALVQRFLGQSGVAIVQRVMGLLLAAIAVQFIAEGGRDLVGLSPPA